MTKLRSILAASALALIFAAPAFAQNLTHGAEMRASKLIGMQVYNDKNEKIGTIDDVLVPSASGEVKAVLSVGDFLGGGTKLVKVPMDHVGMMNDKMVMPGADGMKPGLTNMAWYNYVAPTGG